MKMCGPSMCDDDQEVKTANQVFLTDITSCAEFSVKGSKGSDW